MDTTDGSMEGDSLMHRQEVRESPPRGTAKVARKPEEEQQQGQPCGARASDDGGCDPKGQQQGQDRSRP